MTRDGIVNNVIRDEALKGAMETLELVCPNNSVLWGTSMCVFDHDRERRRGTN